MSIIRVNKKENYSVISNYPLQDSNLSWKAKGILSYLLTKPNDWEVFIIHLAQQSKDGRESTQSGINELIKAGYVTRKIVHNSDGKFDGYDYKVYENPKEALIDKPYTGNPSTDKPFTEDPQLINTDVNQILNKPNTEESHKKYGYEEIDIIYNLYPTRCPIANRSTYKTFKNKTQIERMISKGIDSKLITHTIEWYLADCKKSKTYIKNFTTFLNNLPDLPAETEKKKDIVIIPENIKPELTDEQIKRGREVLNEGREKLLGIEYIEKMEVEL